MVLLNQFGISAGYGKIKMLMNNSNQNANTINTTCPACGLLCDDIRVSTRPKLTMENACSKGVAFFERANINAENISARIAGQPCNLDVAVNKVVEILNRSLQPLIAGLGTEVTGARSVIRLAQNINASLDHMHSDVSVHNTRALQNGGWITTTFAEIKNRADVILSIGTDISSTHPRFFERLASSTERLFKAAKPEVIYLGKSGAHGQSIEVSDAQLPEAINVLNALLNGRKIQTRMTAGIPLVHLQALAEKLQKASYTAVIWSAAGFNSRHADLAVQSITQLIAKLNATTRAAGLPLTSGDGDSSVNQVCTWLNSFPTRLQFNASTPRYDSYAYATDKQLTSTDALIWISSFNPVLPPKTQAPSIVIGHPAMQFNEPPDVFIPVGIPGINHSGLMVRMDSSITLPLKQCFNSTLPSLSDVIAMIETKLAAGVSA